MVWFQMKCFETICLICKFSVKVPQQCCFLSSDFLVYYICQYTKCGSLVVPLYNIFISKIPLNIVRNTCFIFCCLSIESWLLFNHDLRRYTKLQHSQVSKRHHILVVSLARRVFIAQSDANDWFPVFTSWLVTVRLFVFRFFCGTAACHM